MTSSLVVKGSEMSALDNATWAWCPWSSNSRAAASAVRHLRAAAARAHRSLVGPVNDQVANLVVAQLLFLESENPDKDISFYINSPGGSVSAGMAIYDTMQFIKPEVSTLCMGMAASMGAFCWPLALRASASLPNAKVMIHQPLAAPGPRPRTSRSMPARS